MTKVKFGGGVSTINLAYDPSSGTFIPAPNAKMLEGVEIKHLLPSL
jgi:hypothetical protein